MWYKITCAESQGRAEQGRKNTFGAVSCLIPLDGTGALHQKTFFHFYYLFAPAVSLPQEKRRQWGGEETEFPLFSEPSTFLAKGGKNKRGGEVGHFIFVFSFLTKLKIIMVI